MLSRGLEYTSHRASLAAYAREFAKGGLLPPRFHRALLDAYEARLSADYESAFTVDSETARRYLDSAKEFVASAAKFLGHAKFGEE